MEDTYVTSPPPYYTCTEPSPLRQRTQSVTSTTPTDGAQGPPEEWTQLRPGGGPYSFRGPGCSVSDFSLVSVGLCAKGTHRLPLSMTKFQGHWTKKYLYLFLHQWHSKNTGTSTCSKDPSPSYTFPGCLVQGHVVPLLHPDPVWKECDEIGEYRTKTPIFSINVQVSSVCILVCAFTWHTPYTHPLKRTSDARVPSPPDESLRPLLGLNRGVDDSDVREVPRTGPPSVTLGLPTKGEPSWVIRKFCT